MSSMSVDGLVSGLDTTALIAKLMQVEAMPQENLKSKLAGQKAVVSAYQAVNTKMSALQTAAEALLKDETWQTLKATSSSTGVTASATSAATAGQVRFDVTALATAHSIRTDEITGTDAVIADPAVGLDITQNGITTHVDLTDGSLDDVVRSVNAAGAGVSAAAVQVRDGVYRLQLTATKTGTAGTFDVTGLSVGSAIAATGSNASLTVGSGAGAYTVTSSTNTFSGVLPGVTFTVSKVESAVTLTSESDPEAIADKVQALVDAVNGGLSEIDKQSAYDATTNKGSALTGDYTVRLIAQRLSSSVADSVGADGTLKQIGIELDRYGKLTFDRDAFIAQYQADPAKARRLSDSLTTRLQTIAEDATDSVDGSLTLAIKGRNSEIENLDDSIADWDVRLEQRQAALQRQFAQLEVALGQMRSQSNWLAGQLAGLPTFSS